MNIAIVGSREYPDLQRVCNFVGGIAAKHPDAIIVSGGAKGTDEVGETTALSCGLHVISFRPYEIREGERRGRFAWAKLMIAPGDRWPKRWVVPASMVAARSADSWPTYGECAFARNELVVQESDHICAFTVDRPGGTTNTINHAHRLDKPVYEYQLPLDA